MLRNKIIRFKKIYKFYLDHFLIKCTVFVLNVKNVIKNLLASLAHSHRALRAQLASLARMSAPGARDLIIVALRAPTYVNFALRAQCCALHSA